MIYLITKIFDNLGVLEVTLFHEFNNAQIRWGFLRGTGHGFFLLIINHLLQQHLTEADWWGRVNLWQVPIDCPIGPQHATRWLPPTSTTTITTTPPISWWLPPPHGSLSQKIFSKVCRSQRSFDKIKSVQRGFLHYAHYTCSSEL